MATSSMFKAVIQHLLLSSFRVASFQFVGFCLCFGGVPRLILNSEALGILLPQLPKCWVYRDSHHTDLSSLFEPCLVLV